MNIKTTLQTAIALCVKEYLPNEKLAISVEAPTQTGHGDYSTNVAMILGKKLGKNPLDVAEEIAEKLRATSSELQGIEKIEVVKPGFINFWLSKDTLFGSLEQFSNATMKPSYVEVSAGKRIMVEFAHPNTHKEMHIGHMRTLITGEAISRLLEASGATVFRANYQGDIGPHVARAIFGITKLMEDRGLTLETVKAWGHSEKAHFLGEGYVLGSREYEAHKEAIDSLNTKLYSHDPEIMPLYELTRMWSLNYYEEFYRRFGTTFDQLFFESEVAMTGKKIVEDHIGRVFVKENGAIIFPGEKYGLHTRVFITQAGNPTYEGKEMGNAYAEYKAFPFDLKMHIVASEQAGYFQVVFKALDLIDPEKFEGKQFHLSMGMVTLTDRKMSSRTGDILTVDWLIDQVREKVMLLAKEGKIASEKVDETIETITIGAIKYSVLKGGTGQNVAFDIEKSVSLDGNSGPYLQYTFARTQSVLAKSELRTKKSEVHSNFEIHSSSLEVEELQLLRRLYQFREVIQSAAEKYAPNILCNYLYVLASEFNLFYQKHKIVGSESEAFRVALTDMVGGTLQQGLTLLGIKSPDKM